MKKLKLYRFWLHVCWFFLTYTIAEWKFIVIKKSTNNKKRHRHAKFFRSIVMRTVKNDISCVYLETWNNRFSTYNKSNIVSECKSPHAFPEKGMPKTGVVECQNPRKLNLREWISLKWNNRKRNVRKWFIRILNVRNFVGLSYQ